MTAYGMGMSAWSSDVISPYLPDPGGQERHPPRRVLQAEQEHALVVGLVLDRPALAGGAEVRLERDRVERHERVDQPLHLPGRAQQADVGPAPAHHREVPQVRPQDRSHHRPGPAAPAPPAAADPPPGTPPASPLAPPPPPAP